MNIDRQMLYFVYKPEATQAFYLENIFWIETMAYKPIVQGALEYKPCGFLPGHTV